MNWKIKCAKPPISIDPDVENLAKKHSKETGSLWDNIKRILEDVKETWQYFKHNTEAEFSSAYNKLRLFDEITDKVKKEAYELIAAVVVPIVKDKNLFEAFERHIVLQDLVNDIDAGLFDGKELPWGYNNASEVMQDLTNMRVYLRANPILQQAAKNRSAMIKKVKAELVANNLLKDSGNINYFHHQVRFRPQRWQTNRLGSTSAYNTNYLESEFELLTLSLEQIAIKDLLNKIGKEINIKPSLVEQANKENIKITQVNDCITDKRDHKKIVGWRDFIPEGYRQWFPKIGTYAYKAASIEEKAVQNILTYPADPNFIEQYAEVDRSMWVIPAKVADQLDSMKDIEKAMAFPSALRRKTGKGKWWNQLDLYRSLKLNGKIQNGTIIFMLILSVFLSFAITQNFQWNKSVEIWRQYNIQHSLTVCVTSSGARYHNCYHYRKNNFSMSLFEAVEQKYSPCGSCHPPPPPIYAGKPDRPPFYFYHWIITTIIFSFTYWIVINQINNRT